MRRWKFNGIILYILGACLIDENDSNVILQMLPFRNAAKVILAWHSPFLYNFIDGGHKRKQFRDAQRLLFTIRSERKGATKREMVGQEAIS